MKVAVSDCLLGTRCRFDGASKANEELVEALHGHTVVAICPEMEGGLPCPRPASEMRCEDGVVRVINTEGDDVTEAFRKGAAAALSRALEQGCQLAVLKAKSPSCGSGMVYDGTFSGRLVPGYGIAARMFSDAGIPVMNESEFPDALRCCHCVSPDGLDDPSLLAARLASDA